MEKWISMLFYSLFCLGILSFATPGLTEEPVYNEALLFPMETWHNHGSSIVECPDGSLLACWFHGSGERKSDDVLIQGTRKAKGAKTWSERFLMADTPNYPDCNPVLFVAPDNRLWMLWSTVLWNRWESCLLKYKTSTNYMNPGEPEWQWQDVIPITPPDSFVSDMLTPWNDFLKKFPALIPKLKKEMNLQDLKADEELYYFMKNKVEDKQFQRLGWMTRIHPLALPNGKILLPLYTDAFSVSLIASTTDEGKTWQASRPLAGFGNIQPSLVRKNDGSLVAYMRENGPRQRIRVSTSADEGYTWSPVTETEFPNPGSSVEVLRLQNGHWILIYNDTIDGRHQLKVSVSDDEGKTWKWHRYLEKQEPSKGSFSYPSIIQAKDGLIHATYSYSEEKGVKSIKWVSFNESWISG